MIARWAIAPPHHPLNRYAVTGGALRRVPVDARRPALGHEALLRLLLYVGQCLDKLIRQLAVRPTSFTPYRYVASGQRPA